MKTLLTFAAATLMATASYADDVFGTWKTAPDDNGRTGHIKVGLCSNGKICGQLVQGFDENGKKSASPHDGKLIIWDMEPQGDGKYGNGKVWAPDRDKTYNSKMELVDNNNLKISGCILMICRDGGVWSRVN